MPTDKFHLRRYILYEFQQRKMLQNEGSFFDNIGDRGKAVFMGHARTNILRAFKPYEKLNLER
uniref:Transposase n=1 Tax=Heterorhabditis bacteriophora TaxID=37862 RepID=A0A1I7X8H5_HETBA